MNQKVNQCVQKNAYTVIGWGMEMNQDPFKEYIRESEPNKREKGYAWQTAIGLQAVDGLKTSKYLIDIAIRNIEGDISIDEANSLLNSYYEENPKQDPGDRTEEADKVSVRIVKVLSETGFSFTPNEYISIHKKLFTGIYRHAGKIRDYNITKKSGYETEKQFFMEMRLNSVTRWNMTSPKKEHSAIKGCRSMK